MYTVALCQLCNKDVYDDDDMIGHLIDSTVLNAKSQRKWTVFLCVVKCNITK